MLDIASDSYWSALLDLGIVLLNLDLLSQRFTVWSYMNRRAARA